MAEYNAYTAAQATKDPTAQIKALDDFVAKYPNSALLIYVYPLYFNAYSQLKNWPKVIEYADKTLALGDKIEPPVKYQAYYARAFAYTNIQPPPTDPDQAKKARQAALDGLQTLNALKKPDSMSHDDFDKQKKAPAILFNYTAATAAAAVKDNAAAIESYKAVLVLTPDDAVTAYRIGQAYESMQPPQQIDAFWYFAKAVTREGREPAAGNASEDVPPQADRQLPAGFLRQPDRCRIERALAARGKLGGSAVDLHAAKRAGSRCGAQGYDDRFGDHRPEGRAATKPR